MVDKGLVPCLGAIEDKVIDFFGISISMDLHVILIKGPFLFLNISKTLDARITCNT